MLDTVKSLLGSLGLYLHIGAGDLLLFYLTVCAPRNHEGVIEILLEIGLDPRKDRIKAQ